MREQVTERKSDARARDHGESGGKSDAFSMLVEASENEEAKFQLDDSELASTTFLSVSCAADQLCRSVMCIYYFLPVTVSERSF